MTASADYSKHYNESSLIKKVISLLGSSAYKSLIQVVALYYCAQDPKTPMWAKSVIIAALGYFISPIDAIPDITPIVGLSDDWGVVGLAILQLGSKLRPEHYDSSKDFLNMIMQKKRK